jgi:hypothetical protein
MCSDSDYLESLKTSHLFQSHSVSSQLTGFPCRCKNVDCFLRDRAVRHGTNPARSRQRPPYCPRDFVYSIYRRIIGAEWLIEGFCGYFKNSIAPSSKLELWKMEGRRSPSQLGHVKVGRPMRRGEHADSLP